LILVCGILVWSGVESKKASKNKDNEGSTGDVKSCPYAQHFRLHKSGDEAIKPSEHYHKKAGTESSSTGTETDDDKSDSVVPKCPAFSGGCPLADLSKYTSEQMAELVKQCPIFKEGCPFKKHVETGEVSLDYTNCPAFKDGCPFANMSEWTEEQKAQIEQCPLFKKGCPFNGGCPFSTKEHKGKDKKKEKDKKDKEKKDKTYGNLLGNYIKAMSSFIEDDSLLINMLADNVKGAILVGDQPPKVLQGKEQVVAWFKNGISRVTHWNMQWRDIQFVKESSRIYETRKNMLTLSNGEHVEYYSSDWATFVQGKITEFELLQSVVTLQSEPGSGASNLNSEQVII